MVTAIDCNVNICAAAAASAGFEVQIKVFCPKRVLEFKPERALEWIAAAFSLNESGLGMNSPGLSGVI